MGQSVSSARKPAAAAPTKKKKKKKKKKLPLSRYVPDAVLRAPPSALNFANVPIAPNSNPAESPGVAATLAAAGTAAAGGALTSSKPTPARKLADGVISGVSEAAKMHVDVPKAIRRVKNVLGVASPKPALGPPPELVEEWAKAAAAAK